MTVLCYQKGIISRGVFIDQFRPQLLGCHFLLQTDHGVLTWLLNFKEPEGQMARWLKKLQEYSFQIVHHCSRKHTNVDSLSHLPYKQCGYQPSEQLPVTAVSLQMGITSAELHKLQQEDSIIHPVLASKISGEKLKPDQIKQYSPHQLLVCSLGPADFERLCSVQTFSDH